MKRILALSILVFLAVQGTAQACGGIFCLFGGKKKAKAVEATQTSEPGRKSEAGGEKQNGK